LHTHGRAAGQLIPACGNFNIFKYLTTLYLCGSK
jgi:hypothetical protein